MPEQTVEEVTALFKPAVDWLRAMPKTHDLTCVLIMLTAYHREAFDENTSIPKKEMEALAGTFGNIAEQFRVLTRIVSGEVICRVVDGHVICSDNPNKPKNTKPRKRSEAADDGRKGKKT